MTKKQLKRALSKIKGNEEVLISFQGELKSVENYSFIYDSEKKNFSLVLKIDKE